MAEYSFTEKKRIRKSFAKRASVLPVPFLLETQLASYRAFLQLGTPAEARKNEGLQAAFTSIFPISSHSGNASGFLCCRPRSTLRSASNAASRTAPRCAPRCA